MASTVLVQQLTQENQRLTVEIKELRQLVDNAKLEENGPWMRNMNGSGDRESVTALFAKAISLMISQLRSRTQQWWTSATRNILGGSGDPNTPYVRIKQDFPDAINEEDWEKYQQRAMVLFPVAPRKFAWDIFMLLLILYSSVTVPFRLGMDHPAEGGWWIFEVAVSFCFLADLRLNFITAYPDGDQYILNKDLIRTNYLKGWFLIDLTSSIPVRRQPEAPLPCHQTPPLALHSPAVDPTPSIETVTPFAA